MDQLTEFRLDAWRATGRHIDITTLTTQHACWPSIHVRCVTKCADSRWLGASFALDGPR